MVSPPPPGAHPFTSTADYSGLIGRLELLISAKKHCNPRDWPHPPFLWQTPTWQRHHSIERGACLCRGSFMCAGKYLMVQKSDFASMGHFLCFFCTSLFKIIFKWDPFFFFFSLATFIEILKRFISTTSQCFMMQPSHASSPIFLPFSASFKSRLGTAKSGNLIPSRLVHHTILEEVFLLLISLCASSASASSSSSSALLWFIICLRRHTKAFTPTETARSALTFFRDATWHPLFFSFFWARVTDITSWKKWRHREKTWQTNGPSGKSVSSETLLQHLTGMVTTRPQPESPVCAHTSLHTSCWLHHIYPPPRPRRPETPTLLKPWLLRWPPDWKQWPQTRQAAAEPSHAGQLC